MYSSAAGAFWHFDSAGDGTGSRNATAAEAIAQALSPHLLGCAICIVDVLWSDLSIPEVSVTIYNAACSNELVAGIHWY